MEIDFEFAAAAAAKAALRFCHSRRFAHFQSDPKCDFPNSFLGKSGLSIRFLGILYLL